MAGVSTPAISNAGALGGLGLGATDAVGARAMIVKVRATTTRPFNVNVFVHTPARRDAAREAAWVVAVALTFRGAPRRTARDGANHLPQLHGGRRDAPRTGRCAPAGRQLPLRALR